MRHLLASAFVLAASACASTSAEGPVCGDGCPAGRSCVAGLCRTSDALPSPADATRVVLTPLEVAVASSGGGASGETLPATLALGRASSGTVALFLRFESAWRDDTEITSAFLVLDPVEGASPPARRPSLEVASIVEPWTARSVSWGRQPRTSLPETAGSTPVTALTPLRVDVTTLVRDWAKHPDGVHGIALFASGSDAAGASYGLGPDSGAGPRLEAYVR